MALVILDVFHPDALYLSAPAVPVNPLPKDIPETEILAFTV